MDREQAVRPATRTELPMDAEIFGHHVRNSVATFEAMEGTIHLAPNATGRRIGHNHGRWIDAVRMQRELRRATCPSAQPPIP